MIRKYCVWVLLFLISCINKNDSIVNNEVGKSIDYHVEEVDVVGANMSIADYVDSCYYVPLETGADVLINQIERVEYDMGLFFVLDSKQDAIFIFNEEGHFLRKISKKGKGPDEYYDLKDFFLNKQNKLIEICDRHRDRILCYDYNGKLITVKKFYFELASRFVFNGRQYFFHYEDLHSETVDCTVFDMSKEKVNYMPVFRPTRGVDKFYSPMIGSQLAMSGNDIYSVFLCNPNVYRLNETGVMEIAFSFDFGVDNVELLLDKYIGKSEDVLTDILLDYGYPTTLGNFTIAGNTLYFMLVANEDRRVLHFYYDMKSKKSLSLYGLSYTGKCIVNPGFVKGNKTGFFISVIEATQMMNYYNYYNKEILQQRIDSGDSFSALKKASMGLTMNSNPVLMIFKPRI